MNALDLYINGTYFIYNNGDASGIYTVANELINGNRHSALTVSYVGTALLQIPFIYFLKLNSFIQFLPIYTLINFIFFGTGSFLLTMFISKILVKSNKALHLSAISYILITSSIWIFRYGGVWNSKFTAGTSFTFLPDNFFGMAIYNRALINSWNTLSDNPSVFLMLLLVFLLLKIKSSYFKYFLLGALCGFSLCIRYTSVLIIPPVIIYDLYSLLKNKNRFMKIVRFYIVFSISVILFFLPQLFDNYFINGNCFVPVRDTVYSKGSSSLIKIFSFKNALMGFKFFYKIHFKLFLVASCLLFFIKNKKNALFLWFCFIIPLSFYCFSGYFVVSAVRFLLILFPVICIIIGNSLVKNDKKELFYIFFFIMIINSLFYPECSRLISPNAFCLKNLIGNNIFFFNHFGALVLILIFLILYLLKQIKIRFLFILSIYLILFSLGLWYVPLILNITFPLFLMFNLLTTNRKFKIES